MKNRQEYYLNIQNTEQGFTLIEVLIVIVVFSVGLLALSAMQFSATKGNSGAYKLTEATYIASSKIEELLSDKYSDISDYEETVNGYNITCTVNAEEMLDNLKKISLTITRTDGVSITNTYELFVANIQ